jgi:hypothetical protein
MCAYDGSMTIIECFSTGDMNTFSGGIVGRYGARLGEMTITDCYSTGAIGTSAGGIVGHQGAYDGSMTIINCSSRYTGTFGSSSGGIAGYYCAQYGNMTIKDCYSIGNIGASGGGIVGKYGARDGGGMTITDCSSNGGVIGDNAGGIVGYYGARDGGKMTITDCWSEGNITGSNAGGIVGNETAYNGGRATIESCHSYGIASTGAYGIYGGAANNFASLTITGCTVTTGSNYHNDEPNYDITVRIEPESEPEPEPEPYIPSIDASYVVFEINIPEDETRDDTDLKPGMEGNRSLNGSYGLCDATWNHVGADVHDALGYRIDNAGNITWDWTQVVFKRFDDIPMRNTTTDFPDGDMYMYFFYSDNDNEWGGDGDGNHLASLDAIYETSHGITWVPFPGESEILDASSCGYLTDACGNTYIGTSLDANGDAFTAVGANYFGAVSFKTDTTFVFADSGPHTWRCCGCENTSNTGICGKYHWYANLHMQDTPDADATAGNLETIFDIATAAGHGLSTDLLSIFSLNSRQQESTAVPATGAWWIEGYAVEEEPLYNQEVDYDQWNGNSFDEFPQFVESITITDYAREISLSAPEPET